jgi:hypothetical protein
VSGSNVSADPTCQPHNAFFCAFLLFPRFVDPHAEQEAGESQCSGEPTTPARTELLGGEATAELLARDATCARP